MWTKWTSGNCGATALRGSVMPKKFPITTLFPAAARFVRTAS